MTTCSFASFSPRADRRFNTVPIHYLTKSPFCMAPLIWLWSTITVEHVKAGAALIQAFGFIGAAILAYKLAQTLEEHKCEALAATFTTRGTHELPAALPPPPESWENEFVGMATEANLSTTDYLVAFRLLDEFWTRIGLGPPAA